jgi:hypothetical protein
VAARSVRPVTPAGNTSRSSAIFARRSHVFRLAVARPARIGFVSVFPFASARSSVISRASDPRSISFSHTVPSSALTEKSSRSVSVSV